jgi:hypothetical protein
LPKSLVGDVGATQVGLAPTGVRGAGHQALASAMLAVSAGDARTTLEANRVIAAATRAWLQQPHVDERERQRNGIATKY